MAFKTATLLLASTVLASTPALAQETETTDAPKAEALETEVPETSSEDVDISAPGATADGDIVVRGRYIPDPIRATPAVVSVLSAEDIARSGEGDVAAALQRVTGLSVVGGRFVYVRGLGERYSLALLNGSPLPSPEPLRRVVPLDLFPTSILASTVVQKTYAANYPGEFGGGVINLTTRSAPEESFLEIKGSVGGDSFTTGNLGYTYYGGDWDWTGFDDGTRSLPKGFAAALATGDRIVSGSNFSDDDLKGFGASLVNAPTTLIQSNNDIPINFGGEISAGTSFDLGGARVGVIGVAGIDNSWTTRQGKNQLGVTEDFDFLSTTNRSVVNGMLNIGVEFDAHKVRFTNLFIRDTLKEARVELGFNSDASVNLLQTGKTSWYERQLFNSQLAAEFQFGALGVDLRGTYAKTKRDAPYERSYTYAFNSTVDDFVNSLRTPDGGAAISFSELDDELVSAAVDVTYELPTTLQMAVSAGYAYSNNERSAIRRDFEYQPRSALPLAVQQQRIDYLLSDFNLYVYDILLTEVSGGLGASAYDARLENHAGYVQFDGEILPLLRATIGVRYEDAVQTVTPLALFGAPEIPGNRLANDYWLPAATLTWNPIDDMQFRLSASKTIARPQFREQAPQPFRDPDTDRLFYGNPFLTDSKLTNIEGRWEWYFDRDQRLSVGAFYKDIKNPIESVVSQQGSSVINTYANAPKATLYGAEIELQKYFDLADWSDSAFFADRRLVAIANYTYSDSEIKVSPDDQTIGAFSNGVPSSACTIFYVSGCPEVPGLTPASNLRLTGHSKHLVNLQLGMENVERLSQQTILLTFASKRSTARGPNATADYIEKPGLRLDVVLREGVDLFGQEAELKLQARNLTGTDYKETQDLGNGEVALVNVYDVGTSFSASLSLRF